MTSINPIDARDYNGAPLSAGSAARPRAAMLAAALGIAVFLAHLALAVAFQAQGWFLDYDFLFDADPNIRLQAFAQAYPGGDFIVWWLPDSLHPLLPYVFGVPIVVASKLVGLTGLASPAAVANTLGLAIVPAATGLKAAIFVLLLARLGLTPLRALLLAALGSVSFSDVIFGSIPETFPLTSMTMTALLWLTFSPPQWRSRPRLWTTRALELLAIGLTITNVAWTWALRLLSQPWPAALSPRRWVREGVISVALLIGVIAVTFAVQEVHGYNALFRARHAQDPTALAAVGRPPQNMFDRFSSFTPAHIGHEMVAIPQAMLRTIYAPDVRVMPKEDPALNATPMTSRFTMTEVPIHLAELPIDALLIVLIVGGVMVGWNSSLRPIVVFALFVLATNFCLHLVFGREPFLYSQHWLPALLLCIAPVLLGSSPIARRASAAVAVLILATAAQHTHLLMSMFSQRL